MRFWYTVMKSMMVIIVSIFCLLLENVLFGLKHISTQNNRICETECRNEEARQWSVVDAVVESPKRKVPTAKKPAAKKARAAPVCSHTNGLGYQKR